MHSRGGLKSIIMVHGLCRTDEHRNDDDDDGGRGRLMKPCENSQSLELWELPANKTIYLDVEVGDGLWVVNRSDSHRPAAEDYHRIALWKGGATSRCNLSTQ